MKTRKILLLLGLLLGISMNISAQTPKDICSIVQNPVNGEYVLTVGVVSSASGDEFRINAGGCQIKCDGDEGNIPSFNQTVMVWGRIEIDDDDDDELEIDVESWVESDGTPPAPPMATVFTIPDALAAPVGTVAGLTGRVTSWTDENDGEGILSDGMNSIAVDFPDGNKPALDQEIDLLGITELNDNNDKEVDIKNWVPNGDPPPAPSISVAWSISQAKNAPDGTYVYAEGEVTEWTNQNDGEGVFEDQSADINIDFEDQVDLPVELTQIDVIGIVDTENMAKEIDAYFWYFPGFSVGVKDIAVEKVDFFPNPTSGFVWFSQTMAEEHFSAYNAQGQIIMTTQIGIDGNVDFSLLGDGLYFIHFENLKYMPVRLFIQH